MGGSRGRLVFASRARRLRGCLPRVLPGRLPLRRLATFGSGHPLRSAAALAHGIRGRQYCTARARLAFSARHRCQLWHLVSGRGLTVRRHETGAEAERGQSGWSLGHRRVFGRGHAVVPRLAPPHLGGRRHRGLQALDRRLLLRGSPSHLRRQPRGCLHRGLPDGRSACPPVPLWGLPTPSPHPAGIWDPFLHRLCRHFGAHGCFLHRARGLRSHWISVGQLARVRRMCGAAATARWRRAGDAKHVHVVSLAYPDLAQRNPWSGPGGRRLALRHEGVRARQSLADPRRLAGGRNPRSLQVAVFHRERPPAVACASAILPRGRSRAWPDGVPRGGRGTLPGSRI